MWPPDRLRVGSVILKGTCRPVFCWTMVVRCRITPPGAGNPRACQFPLGHGTLEGTVRYLRIKVDEG